MLQCTQFAELCFVRFAESPIEEKG